MLTRNRLLNTAAWLVLAAVLALVVGTFPAKAQTSGSCKTSRAGTGERNPSELGQFHANNKHFDLRFDDLKTPQTKVVTIEAYTNEVGPKHLVASIDEGLTSKEGHMIGDGLVVGGEVLRVGNSGVPTIVRLCVKIEPDKLDSLPPGRYEGVVSVRADNYQDAALPVVATFRSSRGDGLRFAIVGAIVGFVVKMLTELAAGHRTGNPGAWHGLRGYVLQWGFPLAIILGVLAVWLGFVQMYEANATWGAADTDALKLFGACFAFQMGSIGGADMAKRMVAG